MDKELIRAMIVADEKRLQRAIKQKQKSCREAIKLLQATDIDKRLELIDYLFADKVEEVIEFHLRKNYEKPDLGFGELK
jgi:hypothetical protein